MCQQCLQALQKEACTWAHVPASVCQLSLRVSRKGFCTQSNLLVDEDEAEHGPAEAPLVGALLKQHNLKQCGQQRRQQLRPLLQVLRHFLHTWHRQPVNT